MITRQTLRGPNGAPFLRRWVLRLGPVRLYLHQFTGDDPRDAYHSHPFTAVSVVLRGAYVDVEPYPPQYHDLDPLPGLSHVASPAARHRLHRAPSLNLVGRAYHRTDMAPGCSSCWTVMLAWQPRGRAWGFLRKDGRRVDAEAAWAEGLRLAPEPGVRR